MEEIIFNPIKDKSPSGTLKKGETITFSFRIKQDLLIDKIMLVLRYEKTNFVYNLECKLSEYEVNYKERNELTYMEIILDKGFNKEVSRIKNKI